MSQSAIVSMMKIPAASMSATIGRTDAFTLACGFNWIHQKPNENGAQLAIASMAIVGALQIGSWRSIALQN